MSNIRWGDQLNYYCEHELKYHGDVETYWNLTQMCFISESVF
jgi:hypothetical protein